MSLYIYIYIYIYILKSVIRAVCLLHVAATHVVIIREARYEWWIYRDFKKKFSEPMHRCKILSIKNKWLKIRMFRSILIIFRELLNPLNPELNSIFYLLALLAHHFLQVSRIRVKSLTIRLLMSYIYGAPILDVSRSHTTTQHSR